MAERSGLLHRLLRRKRPAPSAKAAATRAGRAASASRGRFSLADAVLTGVGLGLGAASFTFPWYVFFHQEEFGVRVSTFGGNARPSDLSGPFYTHRVNWSPQPLTEEEIAALDLDFVPTGTVGPRTDTPARAKADPQPFPVKPVAFSLVHVAKGRAMIQDANGFWVVERGSILPDNSRVAAIEQVSGKWVLRTSDNRIVELAK